jgi:YVTN family beta-propeller protein
MPPTKDRDNELDSGSHPDEMRGPFIGPQAFSTTESDLFFGRDDEANMIISLISAHKISLVCAQSGVGKTSIINAKVIPELKKNGFEVLPVARVGISTFYDVHNSGDSSNDSNTLNPYIFNAMCSMKSSIDPNLLAKKSFSNFLYHYFPNKIDNNDEIIPQVLVLDQLEELFSFHPEWQKQRHDFFNQVTQASNNNSSLRIVFIIKEDYLAALDPFVDDLPEKLRARFRFEPLRNEAALEAILGPLERIRDRTGFGSPEELEIEAINLVKDLKRISVEDSTGVTRQVQGEFIEPIHLQVICQRWWNKKKEQKKNKRNRDIMENPLDVDSALAEFYNEVIIEASRTGVSESEIRNWCEKKLITSSETRSTVHRGAHHTEGVMNGVIDILHKKQLIRGEWRAGARWYELVHDRLIKPIKISNQKFDRQKRIRNIKIAIPSTIAAIIVAGLVISWYVASISGGNIPDIDQIAVGQLPNNVDINPNTKLMYVTNQLSDTVSVIDTNTNIVTDNITVGSRPFGVAVNPMTSLVYVTNSLSNSVSVIDTKTNNIRNITVELGPLGVAVNPSTNMIYVANADSNTVSVIDGENNTVVDNIPVGSRPFGIAVDTNSNTVYVTNQYSSTVSVIDTKTNNIRNITVELGPLGVAVNPSTNMIYVANADSNTVSVIDGENNIVVDNIPVGSRPFGIAVDTNSNTVYVTNQGPSTVTVIDGYTNGIIQTLTPGDTPRGVTFQTVNNRAYVVNAFDNSVTAFYIPSQITPNIVQVGISPTAIAINPNTGLVYVSNYHSGTVSVIEGKRNIILTNVNLTEGLNDIAINPNTNLVYVTNSLSNSVSVIDGENNTVVDNISVELGPLGVAVNPSTNMIYVANADSNTVSVIDGENNIVVDNIPVGPGPFGVAVNPNTNLVYITNYLSNNTVSVIDGDTYNVTVINVTGSPLGVAVNPSTNLIYVSNYITDTMTVIDGASAEPGPIVQVGNGPIDITVDPITNSIYVANFFNGTLSVVDGKTNILVQSLAMQDAVRASSVDLDLKTGIIYLTDPGFPEDNSSGLLRMRGL